MDTTETYIKQCEKAEEIQALWRPQGGDYYLHNYRGTTGFDREQEKQIWGDNNEKWQRVEILCYKPMEDKVWFVSTAEGESHVTSTVDLIKHGCIWLPTQSQLQAMVQPNTLASWRLVGQFTDWCEQQAKTIVHAFASMEQLWLAFVMKKYNKVWNGEDWI